MYGLKPIANSPIYPKLLRRYPKFRLIVYHYYILLQRFSPFEFKVNIIKYGSSVECVVLNRISPSTEFRINAVKHSPSGMFRFPEHSTTEYVRNAEIYICAGTFQSCPFRSSHQFG